MLKYTLGIYSFFILFLLSLDSSLTLLSTSIHFYCYQHLLSSLFLFFFLFFFLFVVDFVIHWNETAKGLHVFPIPIPPPPPSPPIPSRFSQCGRSWFFPGRLQARSVVGCTFSSQLPAFQHSWISCLVFFLCLCLCCPIQISWDEFILTLISLLSSPSLLYLFSCTPSPLACHMPTWA